MQKISDKELLCSLPESMRYWMDLGRYEWLSRYMKDEIMVPFHLALTDE